MTSPQVVPTPSDPNSTATQISRVFELSDLRPSTRRTYELAVKGFLTWNGTRALGPSTLIEYKNALLLRSDLSAKTKNLYLSAVRTVVRRLFELGILEVDLSKTVRSLTISSKHKHTPISDSQVRHALSYVAGLADAQGNIAPPQPDEPKRRRGTSPPPSGALAFA